MALVPWQATVQDDFGNIVLSPVVTVRKEYDASLATIYDIDGVETDNPITGTTEGFVQFQAAPGRYTIEGAKDGSTTQIWEWEASALEPEKANPFVILGLGQSSMASSNPQAAGGTLTVDPNILYWNGTAWVVFDPASGVGVGAAGRNSIAFQTARAARADGYARVYVINRGEPGDAIAEWVGDGVSSANYVTLKGLVEDALADLPGKSTVDRMIWGQGESDGGPSVDVLAYRTAFETLKSQLRAETWFPADTPITCLEMPSQGAASTMNQFFTGIVPYDADPYVTTTRTKGLDDGDDNLHWTGAAMDIIGPRAWDRLSDESSIAITAPGTVDYPTFRARMESVFGKGLFAQYNADLEQINVGTTSDAAYPDIAQSFLTFDINDDFIRLDRDAFALNPFEFLSSAILDRQLGSAFLDPESTVNTVGKKEAALYYDSSNDRLVAATGSDPSDPWANFHHGVFGRRVAAAGTANAITIDAGGLSATPQTGMQIRFRPLLANTGATTISVDGGTAIDCRTPSGEVLPGAYIKLNSEIVATYDGTFWRIFVQENRETTVGAFFGQSNMRGHEDATGGDMRLLPNIYFWDGNEDQIGTQFNALTALGQYPYDVTPDEGETYAQNLAYAIAREYVRKTGSDFHAIMYAEGSHHASAFVTPAGRTANGWTLEAGDTDKTQFMYPGIENALDAIPGKNVLDFICINQGEADRGNLATWRAQWSVVLDELEAAGVYNRNHTVVVFGQMVDSPLNNDDMIPQHEAAVEIGIECNGNMGFADSTLLPIVDNNHFSGQGIIGLAKRYVGQMLSPTGLEYNRFYEYPASLVLSDAQTGGNLAIIGTNDAMIVSHRYVVRNAAQGNRPIGVGGEDTVRFAFSNIDTTTNTMTGGNELWVQGLTHRSRNGGIGLDVGPTFGEHLVNGGSITAVVTGNLSSEIRFRDTGNDVVKTFLTVSDLRAAGTSDIVGKVSYPTEIGMYA